MTLNFEDLVKKYDIKIKGIIQAGTHYWQEFKTFNNLGVKNFVLIEPQAEPFEKTKTKSLENKQYFDELHLFNCAISNLEGEMEMFCDKDNEGQSSSLLEPKDHVKNCPWVHFTEREIVEVKRLDNLEFNRSKYNCLVMDIQGAELKALEGAHETLDYIYYIYTEVNFIEMYKGCALVSDLDNFLVDFKRVETGKDFGGWSDALYIRK